MRPKATHEQIVARFWSRVDKTSSARGCWLWTGGRDRKNYGGFMVYLWGRKYRYAHRVSYAIAFGDKDLFDPDKKLVVCHHCDNPPCVNPSHLFLGTIKDNARDAMRKGRIASGERQGLVKHPEARSVGSRNGQALLTEEQVREIRAVWDSETPKPSYRALGLRFGVNKQTIGPIIRRERWTHI